MFGLLAFFHVSCNRSAANSSGTMTLLLCCAAHAQSFNCFSITSISLLYVVATTIFNMPFVDDDMHDLGELRHLCLRLSIASGPVNLQDTFL